MKILFSPVGDTDPIRGRHDGSMLHIVRAYLPEQVVLLLSEKMLEQDAADDRYARAIKSVDKNITVIKIPVRNIPVYDYNAVFNYFHNEFRQYFSNPDFSDKLVNIASGTPQMKMALTLFATFRRDIKCIQVTTPQRDSNAGVHHEHIADIDELISSNVDNASDFENRCIEVTVPAITDKVQVENIKTLVQSYDYTGAVSLIKENGMTINQSAKNLLVGAKFRSILNGTGRASFQGTEFEYDLKKDALAEYLNILQLKLHRGEYADFVRAATPAIEEVLFYALDKYGITKDSFTKQVHMGKSQQSSSVLDMKKIKSAGSSSAVQQVFADVIPSRAGFYFYYNSHLYELIKSVMPEKVYESAVKPIEKLEKTFRNLAAHEIIMVDEQRILQSAGVSPTEVLEKMAKISGVRLGLYDRLNVEVMRILDGDSDGTDR